MKSTVLLADDHAMLRSGLRQTLSQQDNLELVGEASTGSSALKLARELKPDLILMDVHMPEMDGIEASRQILSELPATKIIIFSSDAARALVDEALQVGVCGYLPKEGAVEELLHAIGLVMAGKLYLSPEVSGDILTDYRKSLQGEGEPSLSDREKHLLRLVAEGRRNKEISAELNLGIKSIEAYRARLMKKLGCSSSAELVRYAVREGIAKP